MARFDSSGLDDLIRDMQRMGEGSSEIAEAMTEAASIEIRDAWKEAADEHGLRETGEMIESIGFPGPVENICGVMQRDIYPQGVDSKGVRNAEKAFIAHYGTSRQKPTYWVDDADKKSGPRVQERLESMWGEYLETGKVPSVTDAGGSVSGGGITRNVK